MTKHARRTLFYTLVLLFIVVSPLIVAYAVGYTFNFGLRRVEKTGGIFIKTRMTRLAIFLDGQFIKDTSLISGGALLTEIPPKVHLLKIEKEGFHPWTKTVQVKPIMVTELRNILLVSAKIIYAAASPAEIALIQKKESPADFSLDKKGNLLETGTKKILASGVNSFGVVGGKVLFVDKNGFLARFDPQTKNVETLGRPGFYLSDKPIRFIEPVAGDTAIIDSSDGLFILDASGQVKGIAGGVKNAAFESSGKKLLIQKEHGLEVLWLVENNYQPFQKRGDKEEILRLSAPIEEAAWFYFDDAHIVIRTQEGIFLTELDGRGGRNTWELFSGKTDEILTSPSAPRTIFFRKAKVWQKIEI